jgi:TorA maturation chaperone TorD
LAQFDFSTRHLVNWIPRFAQTVANASPQSLYAQALGVVSAFVQRDNEWQASTIVSSTSDDA